MPWLCSQQATKYTEGQKGEFPIYQKLNRKAIVATIVDATRVDVENRGLIVMPFFRL